MRLFKILFFIILLSVGCTANQQQQEATEPLNVQNVERKFGADKGETTSSDHLLIDARTEVDLGNDQTLTTTEAEALVHNYLNIEPQSNSIVMFDSVLDNGDYLIHVYDLINDDDNNQEHTSRAWYRVNPETREINEYKG